MTVDAIVPDVPGTQLLGAPAPSAFESAVAAAGSAFDRAARSEEAFAHGRGSLLGMVLDRAQADIVLSIAAAAASRTAAALSTVFNLQV
jgi:hypothetical protein